MKKKKNDKSKKKIKLKKKSTKPPPMCTENCLQIDVLVRGVARDARGQWWS